MTTSKYDLRCRRPMTATSQPCTLPAVPVQQGVQPVVRNQPASLFQAGRELLPPVRQRLGRYLLPV
eukprot:5700034-Ditylum_brightwellii.AAC.1